MTKIEKIGQFLEKVTNAELQDRLSDDAGLYGLRFIEHIILSDLQQNSWLVKIQKCIFGEGVSLVDSTILNDIDLDGNVLIGECRFSELTFRNGILLMRQLDASRAIFQFGKNTIKNAENSDFWLGFEEGTTLPKLVTQDPVIEEMFKQLDGASGFVSYNEVKEEMKS